MKRKTIKLVYPNTNTKAKETVSSLRVSFLKGASLEKYNTSSQEIIGRAIKAIKSSEVVDDPYAKKLREQLINGIL